jgi:hypothetical protein
MLLIRALGVLRSTFTGPVVWAIPWLPAMSVQVTRTLN